MPVESLIRGRREPLVVSGQAIGTVFLHEEGGGFRVAGMQDGERVVDGELELVERSAGPRPGKFRVRRNGETIPRQPDEFVDLVRAADAIRISEQSGQSSVAELREMLSAYQQEASVVRTCRYCASAGRYSPIDEAHAVRSGEDLICRACAAEELDRELNYRGEFNERAEARLTELLYEVGDLERITDLLSGGMDPELTRVDTISATAEDVDPVPAAGLPVDDRLRAVLAERFETLTPVQSLSVGHGLLDGADQLVVSATATGKTLIGELAGIDRALRGEGKLLFLVPLVALANQTYGDFQDTYGELVDVTLRVGGSRIRGDGRAFDPTADVIVGTYEGIDHALRTGRDLGDVGTVVIDEIHTLTAEGRGHRLDGLIARLHEYCRAQDRDTQWLYLSATVGNPKWLAGKFEADLVAYEDRPVPIERHVIFADDREKARVCDRLVRRAYDQTSAQGYRGQSIVFTNSRRRCRELAGRLEYDAAAYHAGLDGRERSRVEQEFADGDLAAVVTTAALGAGVDFPAAQVIFDSLAMGIEWLTVQEFDQMLGRAGRPDYHDRGRVYLLVEPGGRYHRSMERTEDEVAFALLTGDTEDVRTRYDTPAAVEETLANVVVAGRRAKALNESMVGELDTTHAVGKLLEYEFIDGFAPTPRGRAVAEHFLSPDEAFRMLEGIRRGDDPFGIVTEVELGSEEDG